MGCILPLETGAPDWGSHPASPMVAHPASEGLIWGLRLSSLRLPQIYGGRFREEVFQSAMPAKHVHHLDSPLFMTA